MHVTDRPRARCTRPPTHTHPPTPLQEGKAGRKKKSNIQSSSCTHKDNILLDRYTRGCKPPATLCECLAALRLPVTGMVWPGCAIERSTACTA